MFELPKELITETKTEIKNGIKYTTHYVNRPIKQYDPLGGPVGETVNGVEKTTEIIKYIYPTAKEQEK